MNEPVAPTNLAAPASNYSHAIVSSAGSRMIHTAGTVPVGRDGSVPSGLVEQAETVWATIAEILAAAGFAMRDVVSVTTYVVAGHQLGPVMAVRDRVMAGHKPASPLVYVPALVRPEWQIEIAVIAAQ